ncbi:hypothetical protein OEV98_00380 [Caldibacillus lycopersici]|uniref:Uncharacterized protein n=1 Tax=Perspicuibacillus lycopersici TaxID=1325689 RepID=A0AAE3LLR1_9BACI|nr:hypothetical protein [Perspicuibacillus lycopersici]MCU9612012.1 hypothetical protein [Perspicuibacillus lycopersici]
MIKIIFWTCFVILLIGGGGAATYFFLTSPLENKQASDANEKVASTEKEEQEEGESQEVVNKPADISIVTLADGMNGHDFISNYHDFYNETLGWGRIDTASYSEQKEKAEEILQSIKGISILDDAIKEDIGQIEHYANIVLESDDRWAMRMLHRLFHDLDIYFNGYDYNQSFGVTQYRGN